LSGGKETEPSIKDVGNRGEVIIKYNNASEMDGIIRKISGDSGI